MISKEQALLKITELVERFEEQYTSYKKSEYNETLTRRDFIDPFFKALGWDTDNEQGYAEAYREVIHEDKIKVGKATKAPDYSFRLVGGKRLFFVEAKKPSVVIKDDILPAYQIRRYGWSAKLPISIITDFEEFAIYDCTRKPIPTDKASVSRIKYFTFREYIKEFDFIWDTFSKERVLKGSFDKLIIGTANKKGTTTVDKEFLLSLDSWRTYLATSISWNNKELSEDEINFAVQQTIDRIIFLRIAEDRSVEPYGNLKNVLKQGDYYKNLFSIFKDADDKYNSGLFDLKKDNISKDIIIDNKVIKTIVNELYYPESPYEFSVLSVEILGSAYEQFLGKQIKIDKAHRAKIEEKPEVRKAGGVYYTPQYVVEYIVKHTIGVLTEGKTPKEVSKLKILDPACGSGSFLIGAYQFLLDWHKNYYSDYGKPSKGKKDNPLTPEGNLTTGEKKRILLNNIYGVDLDVNAVEVTKLSLLLKCMEGETMASINHQMKMFNERVLPTLDNNIKSGNSLIDMDFFNVQLNFEDTDKIKPFSWQKGFLEVFKNGGFDIIIGNPPYVMLQTMSNNEVFAYSLKKYQSAKYKIDTYQLFIEKSIQLLKGNGLLSFITPNTFLKNKHSEPLRKYIIDNTSILEFLLYNYSVFDSASVDTCVFVIKKSKESQNDTIKICTSDEISVIKVCQAIKQSSLRTNKNTDFSLMVNESDSKLLSKLYKYSEPLGKNFGAYFGIQTFDRKKYVSELKQNSNYKPVIDGWNIEPYRLKNSIEFVDFTPSAIKSGGNEKIYKQNRICIRQIGETPIATIVNSDIYTLNTIYNVYPKESTILDLRFVLAIIDSRVTKYFWKKKNSDEKKTFPKIKKEDILSIPIPIITDNNISLYKAVIDDVENLLILHKNIDSIKLHNEIEQNRMKILHLIDRVNEQIYLLFELTKKEIIIIES